MWPILTSAAGAVNVLYLNALLTLQHLSPPAELKELTEHNTTLKRADMRVTLLVVAEFVESKLVTENLHEPS